jgi:hypothetical protein
MKRPFESRAISENATAFSSSQALRMAEWFQLLAEHLEQYSRLNAGAETKLPRSLHDGR